MSLKFIANEPWAITEPGMQLVAAVASRDELFAEVRAKALANLDGKPMDNTRASRMIGDVAILPVEGPLFRKADLLAEISGATSYETIRKEFDACMSDPAVGSIVLLFDSPGGEATGVSELAAGIYAARGAGKKITAYVAGAANSAAYWIASACDEIVCADTGQVGCLGALAIYAKSDKLDQIEFVSTQTPYKNASPTSTDGKARIQARIDALADVFIGAVAKYRSTTKEVVLEHYGKGDVFVGATALKAGMVNRIRTLQELVAELRGPLVGSMAVRAPETQSTAFTDFGKLEVTL